MTGDRLLFSGRLLYAEEVERGFIGVGLFLTGRCHPTARQSVRDVAGGVEVFCVTCDATIVAFATEGGAGLDVPRCKCSAEPHLQAVYRGRVEVYCKSCNRNAKRPLCVIRVSRSSPQPRGDGDVPASVPADMGGRRCES